MSSKEKIMDAAEEIFVSRGFSGSSMKSIAEKANVAKSLLYHYFSSKKDLWGEVVHRRVTQASLPERMIETVSMVVAEGLAAVKNRKEHTTYFEFMKQNPQFVRMLAWLNAEQGFPMDTPLEKQKQMDPPLEMRKQIIEKLKQLQDKGIFRDDIDPRMFVVCFMAICEMWFMSRNRISAWLGDDMNSDEMSERYIDAAGKILLEGMAAKE